MWVFVFVCNAERRTGSPVFGTDEARFHCELPTRLPWPGASEGVPRSICRFFFGLRLEKDGGMNMNKLEGVKMIKVDFTQMLRE